MVPELPNEVWTLVLGKLEDVLDWGRLQQVSRPFYAILADVAWTKVKGLGVEHGQQYEILMTVETASKQKLLMPVEKRLLLVAELADKAVNIIDVSFSFYYLPPDESEEYVELVGRALDKLASSTAQKIESFHYNGDIIMLSPVFLSLASFFDAKKETMQRLSIALKIFVTHFSIDPRTPVLFEALRGCSELESVQLRCYWSPINDPLLESIITGKQKLKNLTIQDWDKAPIPVLLKSGIQLQKFCCDTLLLEEYNDAIRDLGTDDHPLFTLKELTLESAEGLVPSSFSPVPNLEHFKAPDSRVSLRDLGLLQWEFLTDNKDHPGDRKELICELGRVIGAGSGQELADAFPWQMAVQALDDGRTEVASFQGNAAIICRIREFRPYGDDDGAMSIWFDNDSDSSDDEI